MPPAHPQRTTVGELLKPVGKTSVPAKRLENVYELFHGERFVSPLITLT